MTKLSALDLSLKVVLSQSFVQEVLDRKIANDASPRGELLRSSASKTYAQKKILNTFDKVNKPVRLAELAYYTPEELRRMAKLGPKTLRWLEEYLHLLDVVLPKTNSVHGMCEKTQKFLAAL